MLLDKRQTSPSGLDLAGKSIALVYLESESGVDSLFNNRLSDLLALGLEEEYFSGARAVDVLHLVKEEGGDYKSRDSLSRYVMELDSDVVLLVDVPVLVARDSKGREQYETLLYAYDSMGKDTVTVISSKYRADQGFECRFVPAVSAEKRMDYRRLSVYILQWLPQMDGRNFICRRMRVGKGYRNLA